jgi:two-component system, chemotaxis family, response regulator Rcp1
VQAYERKQLGNKEIKVWFSTCLNHGVPGSLNLRSLKILVVEDSASDVRLIREALKESPIAVQVIVAHDGVEAMDYMHQAELGLAVLPDMVLLDLNLPRKNGREVLAEIKGSPHMRQIPVLVMTSSHSDEDIDEVYSLNANCYITKPGDLDEYVNVVRSIENFWFLTATLPDTFHRPPVNMSGPCMRGALCEHLRN